MDDTIQEAFELAVKHVKGDGVEKDLQKATALFNQAATAGHNKAQYNLGVMYSHGIGVTKDMAQAIHWLTLAADQGHTQAIHAITKSKVPQVAIQQKVAPDESRQPSLPASNTLTEVSRRGDIEETRSVVIEENKTNEKIVEPVVNQYSASDNVVSEKISAEALAFLVLFSLAGCAFVAGYFGLNIAVFIFFSLYAASFLNWKVSKPNSTWTNRRFSNLSSVKINAEGLSFLLLFFFAGCALVAGHFGWNIAIYIFCGLYAVSFTKWKVSKPNFTWAKPTVATLLFVVALGVVLQHNDLDVTLPNQYSADSALMNDQTYRAAKSVVSHMRNGGLCEVLAHEIMEYATDLSLPQRTREIYVNKFINKAMQRNCM